MHLESSLWNPFVHLRCSWHPHNPKCHPSLGLVSQALPKRAASFTVTMFPSDHSDFTLGLLHMTWGGWGRRSICKGRCQGLQESCHGDQSLPILKKPITKNSVSYKGSDGKKPGTWMFKASSEKTNRLSVREKIQGPLQSVGPPQVPERKGNQL